MNFNELLILDDALFSHVSSNIGDFETRKLNRDGAKRAAVAVTIVNVRENPDLFGLHVKEDCFDQAALILTRRSSELRNHSGQWAFPGGRMDEGETPIQTALRELEEEVGLSLDDSQLVGYLDDFKTRSGYTITPVVLWGGSGHHDLRPNPGEVESIHRIPIMEFLREDAPLLSSMSGSEAPVLRMPVGSSWIAAPTAAMIYQFREVAILGNDTRVAHFEQPKFAWS